MIGRLWRTGLRPGRGAAYDQFAEQVSLPMFRQHDGFLGCLMSRTADAGTVFTLWRDFAAVETLERSPTYRSTVARIREADLLAEPQTVEISEVHLAELRVVLSPPIASDAKP